MAQPQDRQLTPDPYTTPAVTPPTTTVWTAPRSNARYSFACWMASLSRA